MTPRPHITLQAPKAAAIFSIAVIATASLTACSASRHCTDPGICWANRDDIVQAAKHCGLANFDPPKMENGYAPWVKGENPDTGPKTTCIIADIKSQGLQVTQ
jgi:hypothetical protein